MTERWKHALGIIGKVAYFIVLITAVLWCAGFVFGLSTTSYSYALIGSSKHNLSIVGTSSLGTRYALIQIGDRNRLANVILDRDELDRVLKMWDAAKMRQSQHWLKIGDFKESDVVNPARLTISAGPGIRFAIVDAGICVRYDLSAPDFQAFDLASKRAQRHFTDDSADTGTKATSSTWHSAFNSTNEALKAQLPAGSWPECR